MDGSGSSSGPKQPDWDEYPPAMLPKIHTAVEFFQLIKVATLASQFDPEELADFQSSRELESTPPYDPALKLSLLNSFPP